MIRAKTIADTLTVTRVLLAFLILWLGVTGGSEALPAAMTVLIFAWTTDLLDGPFARRDPSAPQTWVGERDLHADMSVGFCVLGYLAFAGFIPLWAGIAYLATSAGRHCRSLVSPECHPYLAPLSKGDDTHLTGRHPRSGTVVGPGRIGPR